MARAPEPPRTGDDLIRAQRALAAPPGLFLAMHLANHLALPAGHKAHRAVQALLSRVYRAPGVEALLLALFAAQIGLGLALSRRRGPGRGWAAAQLGSGLYLAVFLVQHVPAVLAARAATPPVETDAAFAAAVLAGWPGLWCAPCDTLVPAAPARHLAAALHFRGCSPNRPPWAGLALGAALVAAPPSGAG